MNSIVAEGFYMTTVYLYLQEEPMVMILLTKF